MRQSRNSLRLEDISKISSSIREFFEISSIPPLGDRILQDYIVAVKSPYDWFEQRQDGKLAAIEDGDNLYANNDSLEEITNRHNEVREDSDAEEEEEDGEDNHEVRLKEKQYLTKGLYYNQINKQNKAFPLPMNDGLEKLTRPKNFALPYDIYCPTGSIKKVPNWKPLSRSIWVDVTSPKSQKKSQRDQKPMCDCTIRCDEDCLNRLLQYECDISNCPFGSKNCGNRALQMLAQDLKAGKRYAAGFEIMSAKKKGYGLKSTRSYSPGELIIEYTGDVISQTEMKRRLNEDYHHLKNFYFLSLEKGYVIDSSVRGSAARFVNHACSPNAEMQKWYVNDVPRIGLFANVRIPAGVEITYDYNFNWFPGSDAQRCYCGSENCRGYISKKGSVSADFESSSSPSIDGEEDNEDEGNEEVVAEEEEEKEKEVPVKRGRGRPRKSEPLAPPPSSKLKSSRKSLPANFGSQITKRPRGRPKKRGPGRPPKTPSKLIGSTKLGASGEPTVKRKPGRPPKKNSLVPETKSVTKLENEVKRGRGRPRKLPLTPISKVTEASDGDNEEPQTSFLTEDHDDEGDADEDVGLDSLAHSNSRAGPVPQAFNLDVDDDEEENILPKINFSRPSLTSMQSYEKGKNAFKTFSSGYPESKRSSGLFSTNNSDISEPVKRGPGRPPKNKRRSSSQGQSDSEPLIKPRGGRGTKSRPSLIKKTNDNTDKKENGYHHVEETADKPNKNFNDNNGDSSDPGLVYNVVNQIRNKETTEAEKVSLVPEDLFEKASEDQELYELPKLSFDVGMKPPYFVSLRSNEVNSAKPIQNGSYSSKKGYGSRIYKPSENRRSSWVSLNTLDRNGIVGSENYYNGKKPSPKKKKKQLIRPFGSKYHKNDSSSLYNSKLIRPIGSGRQPHRPAKVIFEPRGIVDLVNSIF